ncbi:MAG: CapA family protein [Lachnospiraceae bacterium]|nr:CapA family protein [Lachnospiraceae bacterium]
MLLKHLKFVCYLLVGTLLCLCANPSIALAAEEASANPVYISLSAVGDCTLGNDVKQNGVDCFNTIYAKEGPAYFFAYTKDIFSLDDLTIANLEGVLTEKGSPTNKTWRFRGQPEYKNMLKDASIEAVSFANNHCRDYGEISYEDTKANLALYGMPYSSEENICIVEKKGVKIGIASIQCAFRQGDEKEQAEYSDISFLKNLLKTKIDELKQADAQLILVNCHWGIEATRQVTAQQKELGHFAIDEGADLVIGHHPHVLQPVENYNGRYIIYSLGNFCFGGNKNPSDKQTMIWQQVFTIQPAGNQTALVHIIPCRLSSVTKKNDYRPTPLLAGAEREKILNLMNQISQPYNIQFSSDGNLIP